MITTRSILIAEDDVELGQVVAEILTFEGFQTQIIRDGAVVYDQVIASLPALLILDMHLPHRSGTEILNQIRANPDLTPMKILVATADVQLARILCTQVDVVFEKPYS